MQASAVGACRAGGAARKSRACTQAARWQLFAFWKPLARRGGWQLIAPNSLGDGEATLSALLARRALLSAGGESDGEEEEDERLDQQMGETGEEGEDVDERLWNNEDREQDQGGQVG